MPDFELMVTERIYVKAIDAADEAEARERLEAYIDVGGNVGDLSSEDDGGGLVWVDSAGYKIEMADVVPLAEDGEPKEDDGQSDKDLAS